MRVSIDILCTVYKNSRQRVLRELKGDQMGNRKVTFAAIAALAVSLVSGGVSAHASQSSSQKTLTVWSWDVAAEALTRIANQYDALHPGVKINVLDIGYDNAYDKFSVAMSANSGLPDIMTLETDHIPGYIAQFPKGFYDLSSAFKSVAGQFDASKVAAATDATGRLLGIPWDSAPVALFFRSDYFKSAGVNPNSIKSWSDLVAAGSTIKTKTGHTLLSIDVSSGATFLMMLQQQGGGIFNSSGSITLNSPAAVNALTLLKTMNAKGLIDNVQGWDGRVSATKAGHSAAHAEAVWWIGTLQSEMPELSGKFGVRVLPYFTPTGAVTSNNGGSNLVVPATTKNGTLAASFIHYALMNSQNQVTMMDKEGLFPSWTPALRSSYFLAPVDYFAGQAVYKLFGTQVSKIPAISYNSDYAKATDIVANMVVSVVLNGGDVKTSLAGAVKDISNATGRSAG